MTRCCFPACAKLGYPRSGAEYFACEECLDELRDKLLAVVERVRLEQMRRLERHANN